MAGTLRSALHPQRARSVHENNRIAIRDKRITPSTKKLRDTVEDQRLELYDSPSETLSHNARYERSERVMPQITRLTWDNARVSVWPPRGDSV
jgi:hypothetical protein